MPGACGKKKVEMKVEIMYCALWYPAISLFFWSLLVVVCSYHWLSIMILPSGSEPGRWETGTVYTPRLQCCVAVSTVRRIFTKLAAPNRPTAACAAHCNGLVL